MTILGNMFQFAVIGYILVMIAMTIDLVCGIRKARIRGEYTNSTALSRTITKFVTYEGAMLIATGVDVFIHVGRIWELTGWEILLGVPIITCIAGIFIMIVEWISIREKADEKTKKDMRTAAEVAGKLIAQALDKDELREAVTQAVINAGKTNRNENTD